VLFAYSQFLCSLASLKVYSLGAVPSPRGGLAQKKLQVPPNKNMKYKSVEFLLNLNVKPPAQTAKLLQEDNWIIITSNWIAWWSLNIFVCA